MSFRRTFFILVLVAGCSEPGQTEIARGNVLASQKKYADALAAYQAAAAAQPRRAHPQELAGHLLFDLGRSAEARIAYQEAVKREPQDALEAKIGLARLDAEDQRFDDALQRLNGILEKNPQNLYALLSGPPSPFAAASPAMWKWPWWTPRRPWQSIPMAPRCFTLGDPRSSPPRTTTRRK